MLIPALAGQRVHLGVTGSVAAFKALELLRMLHLADLAVSATLTAAAQNFVSRLSFLSLGAVPVYSPMFEENEATLFGHLDPGQTCQAMVIAPATANCLAKLAAGLADDMLSAQALSFPGPLIVAPAMNPRLWQARATQENVDRLLSRNHTIVPPGQGLMACGEQGEGRLAELNEIYLAVLKALAPNDLKGLHILVTLGPTREKWDAVRFWSNPSSGLMGACLAICAWLRGARVSVVAGPVSGIRFPQGIMRHDVNSAQEMMDACADLWPDMDMGCFAAAVADYRPEAYGPAKFKKAEAPDGLAIHFKPNPDILATLAGRPGRNNRQPVVLGFAAETTLVPDQLRSKLRRKKADLLAANDLTAPGSGFGTDTNQVFVLDKNGREETWPIVTKAEVAWRLLDWLGQL